MQILCYSALIVKNYNEKKLWCHQTKCSIISIASLFLGVTLVTPRTVRTTMWCEQEPSDGTILLSCEKRHYFNLEKEVPIAFSYLCPSQTALLINMPVLETLQIRYICNLLESDRYEAILTSDPFTHDTLMCSGITSGGTTSGFLRSVIQ